MFNDLFWMVAADAGQTATGNSMVSTVVYLVVLVISLYASVRASRRRKMEKEEERTFRGRVLARGAFYHIEGLDVPKHAPCAVCCTTREIVFKVSGFQFTLNMEKVTDISLQVFSRTNTQAFPSYWHYAIPRELDVETQMPCITIAYICDNKVKTIILDATKAEKKGAAYCARVQQVLLPASVSLPDII